MRTPVASLSGGQRQSVAVARAMMGEPKLVMLDEPTAALGVAQTRQVLDLILRLRSAGLGVIVISHNLVDVFEVADRIIVLRLGRNAWRPFAAPRPTREQVVGGDHQRADGVGRRRSGRRATTADGDAASTGRPPPRDRRRRATRGCSRSGAGLAGRWTRFRRRVAQGELGNAPGASSASSSSGSSSRSPNERFLSAGNLTNLVLQIAAMGTISVGIVLVLLLGEIDLSVGVGERPRAPPSWRC